MAYGKKPAGGRSVMGGGRSPAKTRPEPTAKMVGQRMDRRDDRQDARAEGLAAKVGKVRKMMGDGYGEVGYRWRSR